MARNRLLLLGGAIGAAIVAVIVVILVAGGGSGSSSSTTTTRTGSTGTEATSSFAGVPQHGDTLGKASAPVTLTVFEDPQCPYCKQWNLDTLPTVVDDYVRSGRLKVVYRGIVVIDDNSLVGLSAAYAAGKQNKLWNMVEGIYERQGTERSGWITTSLVDEVSKEIGANAAKVRTDMKSAAVTAEIGESANQARSYGINGTPTFAIQRPLGAFQQLQVSGLEPSDFTAALDQALQ